MADIVQYLGNLSEYNYTYLKSILLHFDEDKSSVMRSLVASVAVGDVEVGMEEDVGTPRKNRLRNRWELSKEDADSEVFTYRKG